MEDFNEKVQQTKKWPEFREWLYSHGVDKNWPVLWTTDFLTKLPFVLQEGVWREFLMEQKIHIQHLCLVDPDKQSVVGYTFVIMIEGKGFSEEGTRSPWYIGGLHGAIIQAMNL